MATETIISFQSDSTGEYIENIELDLNIDGNGNTINNIIDSANAKDIKAHFTLSNMTVGMISRCSNEIQQDNDITIEIKDRFDVMTTGFNNIDNSIIRGDIRSGELKKFTDCDNIDIIALVDGSNRLGHGDFDS